MFNIIKRIFGTQNERQLRKYTSVINDINAREAGISAMSDDEIRARMAGIKEVLIKERSQNAEEEKKVREMMVSSSSDAEKNKHKKKLMEIKNLPLSRHLPEVFALVREASKRTIGLRHFDVQMAGGMVLHDGKIAEMTTGEGKTLVATLPVCLNALSGESVHVVTVNDYLAKRDSEWMGPIYNFLGFSVGVIQHDMRTHERQKAYACDIVYGTNNEFGFDYLRDNMVTDISERVQQHLSFAIVDEVDSILIDEARTPLIISGPVDETNEAYDHMRPVVEEVVREQRKLVREYISKFREEDRKGNNEGAGQFLYLVHKSDPKNREFLDIILKEKKAKEAFDRAQSLLDSKIMDKERSELLEELFFVFDERTREATFSARGQRMMKERFGVEFMIEDIEAKIAELSDRDMPEEEKVKQETELISAYTNQQRIVESIKQLLKAYILFQKDVDYVINDNKIVIVDSFTGRMMPGRRFSDGIHEAIEAKERVEVQRESQTLATITLQNYFRMYDKLSGMTGTAKTEEVEFEKIYLLPVVQIPTNRPLKRDSMPDRIYKTEREKFNAVIEEIYECNSIGRPVLVGTVSIEKSEELSRLLRSRGVKHNVLNAKYHEKEAHIIAQAGRFGAVTIATNMAGRGTDILLGGNAEYLADDAVERIEYDSPSDREKAMERFTEEFRHKTREEKEKVIQAGGLHVVGTERHESRRIDNQLRGRCGRQGDPGSSRFYLSLEDDLMRIFGSDRIKDIMERLGMEEGEVIENPLVTRAVRTAQKRVEGQNFEVRKHLLKYDNVMNQQREVIYRRRRMVLEDRDIREEFFECLEVGLESLLIGWDTLPDPDKLSKALMYRYAILIKPDEFIGMYAAEVVEKVKEAASKSYSVRESFIGSERLRGLEKMVMLSVIDSSWKEYLREIDELREGIYWRAYAQKDPLIEFQHEAFQMFRDLIIKLDEQVAEKIMKISAMEEQYKKSVFQTGKKNFEHKEYSAIGAASNARNDIRDEGTPPPPLPGHPGTARTASGEEAYRRESPKVGRNDPCPCGSGKKYKKCCGM
ncbi:MAG: preprotein translocase subunit SecA [Candidatus Omnitrophica bacterium]|nr:preprotein translocase subunit SecA [Candidatus Omnitrophota bacterium]MDD5488441.1 preprotein translocase subunit SecA [Candidatus Omnitrophota bacterium]